MSWLRESTLAVEFEDGISLKDLPIINKGIKLIDLKMQKNKNTDNSNNNKEDEQPRETLVYDVVFDSGARILTFRSVIMVKNNCGQDLEVSAQSKQSGNHVLR